MSDSESLKNMLTPVSVNLLFDGMVIQEDVYDATATRLIAKSGITLNAGNIERIRSLNAGNDTIYVSGDMFKMLIERMPPAEVVKREELEETTGYAAIKDETLGMLDDITSNQAVETETVHSVSNELSNRLEECSPSEILSLINSLAPMDEYLQRHCVNVSLLNGLIGRWLGMTKEDVDELIVIGLAHDCGKALIPLQVLDAPRKLTVAEFEVMKMHPVHSYELLVNFAEPIRRAARCHHEKVNGLGYPDRVSFDNLSVQSRITAVSDIYDAMISQRAYKPPKSPFSILAMLVSLSGMELDTRLVNLFIQKMPVELIGKQIEMSDGSVGVVRSFDLNDIEYPMIEINGRVIKTNKQLYCLCMHSE